MNRQDDNRSAGTGNGAGASSQQATGARTSTTNTDKAASSTNTTTDNSNFRRGGGYRGKKKITGKANHDSKQNESLKFKGETADLSGSVFQVQAERPKRGQFQDSVDSLKVYSSTHFKNDIGYLNILFTKLEKPVVPEPADPIQKNDDKGKPIPLSKFKEKVFEEAVKQWIKDDKSLKTAMQALYNIVWGQCSSLMKIKLRMMTDFDVIETNGDTTSLLKSIRGISHELESSISPYYAIEIAKKKFFSYR